ncbi:preprotein translocase subunit SecY [Candidatus Shapirobacteria bacterium]|nr:preprotein translocase subunit SecY [Candidatus Shapirobacteria bacterium]
MKKSILSAIKIYLDSWRIPQVRKKLLFTLLILLVFRLVVHIPAPGVKTEILQSFFAQNQFLALLDMFSGGTLANFSIAALGITPYINASVMFQLLGFVFPAIKQLREEGEYGRQKLAMYTRLTTIPLAVLQSFGMYALLRSQTIIDNLSLPYLIAFVLTMTAGTALLLFLGELINQYGIGNGISLLIFSGIVSRYPVSLFKSLAVASGQNVFGLLAFVLMSLGVVGGITFVDEAFLKVPIRYARRSKRGPMSQESYLPLKINSAGVMPIIFALSLVSLPQILGRFLGQVKMENLAGFGQNLADFFAVNGLAYSLFYFVFVIAFAYLYTTVVFNPKEVAENLRKSGGFIPGVRPGISTEKKLNFLLSRVTAAGAIFLGVIAILPALSQRATNLSTLSLGGTGILIVVSVVLELHRLLENLVQTWRYQNYF